MTNREFFVTIVESNLSDEVKEFATKALAKLDATNEKRRNTPSKTALANEPIKEAIVNTVLGDAPMTATEVGAALEITTQKASALLRQLVNDGVVESQEVKGKNGKCKAYTLVK